MIVLRFFFFSSVRDYVIAGSPIPTPTLMYIFLPRFHLQFFCFFSIDPDVSVFAHVSTQFLGPQLQVFTTFLSSSVFSFGTQSILCCAALASHTLFLPPFSSPFTFQFPLYETVSPFFLRPFFLCTFFSCFLRT